MAITTREPAPPAVAGRALPRQLASIVMRALAKEPEARFASMEELGAAVDRFISGRSFFPLPAALARLGRRLVDRPGLRFHPEELS